ncbi:MAG: LacI family DNA-binding transcriptional regulator [Chloroflexota bacterium]
MEQRKRRSRNGEEAGGAPGRPPRSGRPTMADVAREAGVSVATVSRVINGHPHVTSDVQSRVEVAMAELGYVTNPTARALAGGRTQVIGLLTQEVQNAFSYAVISGVDEAVSAIGYDFLLCTTHARREKEAEYVARLTGGMVDGLLIILPRGLPDYVGRLRAASFPFVLIDYDAEAPGCSVVNATNRQGARAAIRHLVELGHRRIGFITGRPNVGATTERLAGYRDALAEAGIAAREADIVTGDFLEPRGHDAALELLARTDPPTALFASSDSAAFGALRAARELGLRVPDDLSIVGFDDVPEAAMLTPPLTTVRQPLREMGRAAVRQLKLHLDDPSQPATRVVLETELMLRGSTAPPRAR